MQRLVQISSEGFDLSVIAERLAKLEIRKLTDEGRPRASVLIGLCTIHGEPSILYNLRSDSVGSHKGQVSFPGGMQEPTDRDHIHTALRETEEELGIEQRSVEVIGLFHEIPSPFGVLITPVIGFLGELGDLSTLRPNEEIADVFTLSLAQLNSDEHHTMEKLRGRWCPRYTAGPYPVWGLTGFMTQSFLKELFGVDG